MKRKRAKKFRLIRSFVLLAISAVFIAGGLGFLWLATLRMPDLNSFENRKLAESTKIYDRTGTILLYDTGKNAKRTNVPLSAISPFAQKATIAIEDSNFYENVGIEPLSIVRAILANIASGEYEQGASTITQQVVKNALLTRDKTLTRKIKEWVIAIKLTRIMTKDQILETYLNEIPYGGTMYGIEEASQSFFGHPAAELSLGEAAYLAAIPQAPTYYSPYGSNRESLEKRQKLVLQRMKDLGMITKEEYDAAVNEKVLFLSKNDSSIRAPHFVMYVKEYLTKKYGEDEVTNGGLRVITTLDYEMQQKAEDIINKFAPSLEKNFNASNTAMVALDPKTGDILTMVGSRDYFDKEIDGNFNVTLAKRQPGSTFKPFVYATAFKKGYTPETILFDTKTEFSTRCNPDGKPKNPSDDPKKVCYSPENYDGKFEGPQTIKTALAHSRNIPAVKALYLAGVRDSIRNAEDMGISSLTDPDRYGLTLVLGGGEVSLLELTGGYGVFANDGVRNPTRAILRVETSKGVVLEESGTHPTPVIEAEIARQISDILSDNNVRMESLKPIADGVGRPVAIKTGTTNDFKDVWTLGYTPNLVVGAWAGKNDNTSLKQNVAGLIISPLWGAFMAEAVKELPVEYFRTPPPPISDSKPVLRGVWYGGVSYIRDKVSGKLATPYTPPEAQEEVVFRSVHTILHWVNKDDPRGPVPTNPREDSQYDNWEYGVRRWFEGWVTTRPEFKEVAGTPTIPTGTDDTHSPDRSPQVKVVAPAPGTQIDPQKLLTLQLQFQGPYPPLKTELYINNRYILTADRNPLSISFVPADLGVLSQTNNVMVIFFDTVYNQGRATTTFSI